MYFDFGTRKTVEAIATIIRSADRCSPPHMGAMRLLKLLYIADRESLREIGSPILGTRPVAMPLGPVHSEAYDLIRGTRWGEEVWSEFIRRDGREVVLVRDPGVLALSRYEIEKLIETVREYQDTEDFDLVAITHQFEEWKRNYREGTSTAIPLEDIIEAVGRGDDRDEILDEARQSRELDKLFGAMA